MAKNNSIKSGHVPVMPKEVLEVLGPRKGDKYLDLTAGYGGHAALILDCTLAPKSAVLVDRDESAVDHLTKKFKASGVQIVHRDFLSASQELLEQKLQFDIILADLGVSSPHLNTAERGFSFLADGPLDMRMDNRQALTAAMIVNNYPQASLTKILLDFGEEPRAHKLARLIVANRPINTTSDLAQLVTRGLKNQSSKRHKIHPATRTFQALRIAVNNELEQLKISLPLWLELLAPKGRLAVISFHSLEDRIVKQYFAENAYTYDAAFVPLTKKPILATTNEIVSNPRARSAKLRAVAKINI